ncbi:hypothetical protein AAHZ94_09810 [Streptomyces sp. HSW2009]|uniref:hypothetical protein n=1 Tax=Streptomyces sp. HSW2009 TaxID=3142890 RepID=UPI0032EF4C9A
MPFSKTAAAPSPAVAVPGRAFSAPGAQTAGGSRAGLAPAATAGPVVSWQDGSDEDLTWGG